MRPLLVFTHPPRHVGTFSSAAKLVECKILVLATFNFVGSLQPRMSGTLGTWNETSLRIYLPTPTYWCSQFNLMMSRRKAMALGKVVLHETEVFCKNAFNFDMIKLIWVDQNWERLLWIDLCAPMGPNKTFPTVMNSKNCSIKVWQFLLLGS